MIVAIASLLMMFTFVPPSFANIAPDAAALAPRPGAALPLDARFVDEHGRAVRLGEYFGERPAIVVLGYYGCSNLCAVVLNGLATSVGTTGLTAGRDFDVVVASIDPRETAPDALGRKRAVLGPAPAPGWHFLTGEPQAIAQLTRALDYGYAYDERTGQFAHAAGVTIVGSDGRVRQALYGVAFDGDALRAALAGGAPAPSPLRDALVCFRFDSLAGRYTAAALTAVRLAALAALAVLALYVVRAIRNER
jgi:protein SCO1/2